MTKPVTRKMAVDCLLNYFRQHGKIDHLESLGDTFVIPCGICGVYLLPNDQIQFDHHHAIVHNGPHEYQNLRPVHAECHKAKTARDIAAKAKGDRILGLTCNKPKKKIPSRPFQKRKAA